MSITENINLRRFGEKLRALRIHHGFTLVGLAAEIGLKAHGYISEIEAGKKLPTIAFVLNVTRLFNVSTDQLLNDELDLHIVLARKPAGSELVSIAFAERSPTPQELERFRLILSTYQDGTGMLAAGGGKTLPGWRDFERSVALAFSGCAAESKDIIDVRLPDPKREGVSYGISCKMRRELDRIGKDGRVTIELSNSAKKFWQHLAAKGINQANYKEHPFKVGSSLIELVEEWHLAASFDNGGDVDVTGSCYLTLSWSKDEWYQLHQFELALPDPQGLDWYYPVYERNDTEVVGNHLNGDDHSGRVFEWYGESGAQLKYYPLAENAIWESQRFTLELLPGDRPHGILHKAENYFPELWYAVSDAP